MMVTEEKTARSKNPGLAALLSCFYMGLGHLYTGEIRKGIGLMLLYTGSLALIPLVVGLITTPMLWVRGMMYAYRAAQSGNRQIVGEPVVEIVLTRDVEPARQLVPVAEV